ncbi:MAG: aminodeoxychorismate/anthranilate synthase component II [Planctomycetota bacterium]|nr:aminodeoxychorismate/anthranilate synthase component II [Planctomycetota bacterium]RLS24579.1 MAG: aminodeoxychorismate/anthranilate synthase component II [Planctomycetota bacterium]
MILLIDNYDSFTYNLVQRLGEIDPALEVLVRRNDQITLDEIQTLSPERIIISPGPCTPKEAGISCEVIRRFGAKVPILGVCLGHQCMGEALGGLVVRAPRIMHGKTSMIFHDGKGLYRGIASPFEATRYHSLVIHPDHVPPELEVVAWTDQKEIMGVRHKQFPMEGVQYHPESFLTLDGIKLLANFVDRPWPAGLVDTLQKYVPTGDTKSC